MQNGRLVYQNQRKAPACGKFEGFSLGCWGGKWGHPKVLKKKEIKETTHIIKPMGGMIPILDNSLHSMRKGGL